MKNPIEILILKLKRYRNTGKPQTEEITTPEENESGYILESSDFINWKISGEREAAKLLEIKRTTLESRMKKLNIQRP